MAFESIPETDSTTLSKSIFLACLGATVVGAHRLWSMGPVYLVKKEGHLSPPVAKILEAKALDPPSLLPLGFSRLCQTLSPKYSLDSESTFGVTSPHFSYLVSLDPLNRKPMVRETTGRARCICPAPVAPCSPGAVLLGG